MTTRTEPSPQHESTTATALPVMSVGGSPSSGSTLLADLLDSTPGLVCPPELYVLCVEAAYPFDDLFRDAARARRPFATTAGYVKPVRFFNEKYADQTGVTPAVLDDLIARSPDLRGFMDGLANHVANHRKISPVGFVEKTPINVNMAPLFCHAFPDGTFVHIVRDGRDVCASLVRRGFTLYEAAMTWMSQVHAGRMATVAPNTVEVRYEDLVERPFEVTAELGRRLGATASADDVQAGLRDNTYRSGLPRIDSWQVPTFSTEIRPATSYRERLSPKNIAWLESLELVRVNADGVADTVTRFADLLRHYGYVPDHDPGDISLPVDRLLHCHAEFLRKSGNVTAWNDRAMVMSTHMRGDASNGDAPSDRGRSRGVPSTLRRAANLIEGEFAAETLQLLSYQIEFEERQS